MLFSTSGGLALECWEMRQTAGYCNSKKRLKVLTYVGQMLGRRLESRQIGTKGNSWFPQGAAESCFPLVKPAEHIQLPLPSPCALLHPSLFLSLLASCPPQIILLHVRLGSILPERRIGSPASQHQAFPRICQPGNPTRWELNWQGLGDNPVFKVGVLNQGL